MKPKQPKRSRRLSFDARGHPMWERQTDSGSFKREVDTDLLKSLDLNIDQLALEDSGKQRSADLPGSVDEVSAGDDRTAKPAKSIDDLRKLSEEIERARRLKVKK